MPAELDYLFVVPSGELKSYVGARIILTEMGARLASNNYLVGFVERNGMLEARKSSKLEYYRLLFHRLLHTNFRKVVKFLSERKEEPLPQAKRVFANNYGTAFLLRGTSSKFRYHIIHHSEDDPLISGRKYLMARRSYLLPLKKIVSNKTVFERFRDDDPLFWRLGIDTDFFKLSRPIENRDKVVLLPLRRESCKGSMYGLQAMTLLKTEMPDVKFLAYGNWSKSDVPSFITYHFAPDRQTMAWLYDLASVHILPSLFQEFSLPTLEAMHSGCAVVVTNNGAVNDYIQDKVNGLMTSQRDALAIKNAVAYLLKNNEERIGIAKRGLETASTYTLESSFKSFMSLMSN